MCLDSKEVIWPVHYDFYLLLGCRTAYGVIIHLITEIDATSLPPGERGDGRRQQLSPVQTDWEGQGQAGLSSLPFPRRVVCLCIFVVVFYFTTWNINLLERCGRCDGNVSLRWSRAHSCSLWPVEVRLSSAPGTVGHVWVLGNLCAKVWKMQLGRWVWCTLRPKRSWLS